MSIEKSFIAISVIVIMVVTIFIMKKSVEKNSYEATLLKPIPIRKLGLYEKYGKRAIDIICAICAIVVFSPVYIFIGFLVKFKIGSPIIFKQERPGVIGLDGKETVFKMYKFRSMTNEMDANGELLPDEKRMTKFGLWLRRTSLDELPEVFNILNGTMSLIGPRPQLVRDITFMTDEQRRRHTAKPGLSGLAQVNGRNSISWEEKINWDLEYIEKVTLLSDMKILINTVKKAFIKQEGITQKDMVTAEDLGDYLLRTGKIDLEEYNKNQERAKIILSKSLIRKESIDMSNHEPFSAIISVYKNDNPIFFENALSSITEYQTIMPNQIVLVVDGPVPQEIENVIENFQNKYSIFDVIRLPKNKGLGNALKIAVENSKYDLIARMDSDDVSVPNRFEEQLKIMMAYPEIDVIGGDITEFIGDENNIIGKRIVPVLNSEIRKYMKIRCAMNHVTVMYKKSAVQDAGGYLDWFWNEDYYLWIRMWLNNARFANTGSVLVNVRVGKEMYQRRGGKKYFESEKSLQKYMLEHKMINRLTYIQNITKRFVIQKLLPNNIRGWVFKTFARSKY